MTLQDLRRTLFATLICGVITFGAMASAAGYAYVEACGPTWASSDLPLRYLINRDGTPDISSMSRLESIVDSSFSAWSQPCCSSFSSRYMGRTAPTALSSGVRVVLSFETERWHPALGHSSLVIAVTLISLNSNCKYTSAPIHFNNVGFTFSEDGRGDTVLLQDVTTHEVGHVLGLDHSSHIEAIMYFENVARSTRALYSDDVDGVCSLYPANSCGCSSARDCDEGQTCTGGQCVAAPECLSDEDCDSTMRCSSGKCVRRTTSGGGGIALPPGEEPVADTAPKDSQSVARAEDGCGVAGTGSPSSPVWFVLFGLAFLAATSHVRAITCSGTIRESKTTSSS